MSHTARRRWWWASTGPRQQGRLALGGAAGSGHRRPLEVITAWHVPIDFATAWQMPATYGKSRAQVDFTEDAHKMLAAAIEEVLRANPQVVVTPKLVSGQAAPVLIEASRHAAPPSWWAAAGMAGSPGSCSAR